MLQMIENAYNYILITCSTILNVLVLSISIQFPFNCANVRSKNIVFYAVLKFMLLFVHLLQTLFSHILGCSMLSKDRAAIINLISLFHIMRPGLISAIFGWQND